ncbi:tripartite tricarboxylate transporter TctB family protein [Vannielia litorea]|nr:tripartite tricarboxylate transporter TctB family protein [Vannielia litorea]MBY6074158.1 tripartite tricarboxylate transporter TctB family protein [Vannielia litorea]MBY6153338.1 tripartite tricarboxylate transporter TctB family protein [Vannielia litorea]
MSDRIFGGFGVLLAVFYAWAALQTEESFLSDAVGPKAFPVIIAIILGLSSAVIALRPDPEPVWPPLARLAEIGAAAVVMILYAQFLPEAGFIIATALAAMYLTWRLGSPVVQSVVIGALTALVIYIIFHAVLGLSLARGPLDAYVDAVVDPVLGAIGAFFEMFGGSGAEEAAPEATGATGAGD